jgi:peptide/nickel transport system permease protein
MRAYIIRRLLLIVPTLFLASIIVFAVIRFIPGSVIDQMLADMIKVTEFDRAAIEKALGLDAPWYVQYVRWVGVAPYPEEGFHGILQGDLGRSLWKNTPVTEEILNRLPVTFELGLMALLIAQVIALPIGIFSAVRQDSIGDYVARSIAIAFIAVPAFWIGTLVMVYPSLWWGWSPPLMFTRLVDDPLKNLGMMVIPAAILGMALSGVTMRMTRTMMLEVLRQDYVRTAWAKGIRERTVVVRHALKNALIPVITILGLQMPIMIGGTVIIEQIFNLPGMGRLIVEATFRRDYPIISGTMLFLAGAILLINLLVDLTYGFFDPRVQYR